MDGGWNKCIAVEQPKPDANTNLSIKVNVSIYWKLTGEKQKFELLIIYYFVVDNIVDDMITYYSTQ